MGVISWLLAMLVFMFFAAAGRGALGLIAAWCVLVLFPV